MTSAPTPSEGMASFHHFQKLADQENVVFYYTGYFTQTMVIAMGEALRQRISYVDTPNITRRRLFSVFIELAQNMVHYSAGVLGEAPQNDQEIRKGALWIGEKDGRFYVICANPVLHTSVEHICRKLEPLCVMSKDEIRSHYKKQLHSESSEQSKGAGLGLLTVAREASEPIEFEFVDEFGAQNPMTLFYLKAII